MLLCKTAVLSFESGVCMSASSIHEIKHLGHVITNSHVKKGKYMDFWNYLIAESHNQCPRIGQYSTYFFNLDMIYTEYTNIFYNVFQTVLLFVLHNSRFNPVTQQLKYCRGFMRFFLQEVKKWLLGIWCNGLRVPKSEPYSYHWILYLGIVSNFLGPSTIWSTTYLNCFVNFAQSVQWKRWWGEKPEKFNREKKCSLLSQEFYLGWNRRQ